MWRRVARIRNDVLRLLVTANFVPSSPSLATLMMEAICSSETRFLQESHGVTSQETAFFIVTTVKTSNLTELNCSPSSTVDKNAWSCASIFHTPSYLHSLTDKQVTWIELPFRSVQQKLEEICVKRCLDRIWAIMVTDLHSVSSVKEANDRILFSSLLLNHYSLSFVVCLNRFRSREVFSASSGHLNVDRPTFIVLSQCPHCTVSHHY
jgi:hypothetical protein